MNADVLLKPGKEKLLRNRHPWVFSGAVKSFPESVSPGDAVKVRAHDGRFIAHGFVNPESSLAVRLVSWNPDDDIQSVSWFKEKIQSAVSSRKFMEIDSSHNCFRIVHSEADHLPGLVADRFADHVVIMISSAAMLIREKMLLEIFRDLFPGSVLHVDYDDVFLKKEKSEIPDRSESEESIQFRENNCIYLAKPGSQKTGYFLDQKYNRRKISEYVTGGMNVLDAFCYTGGFTLPILLQKGKVTAVDSSQEALELLKQNIELNPGIDPENLTLEKANVFQLLRKYKEDKKVFDLIIQDPPRMSPGKHDRKNALNGYKDLFMQSMHLLKPGGFLAGFSCSHHINLQSLKESLAWAALDADREASVIEIFSQSPDHPVPASFPEAEYLSGFLAIIK